MPAHEHACLPPWMMLPPSVSNRYASHLCPPLALPGYWNSEGLLMVWSMVSPGIGAVCDKNFTDLAATVVCR